MCSVIGGPKGSSNRVHTSEVDGDGVYPGNRPARKRTDAPALPLQFRSYRVADDAAAAGDESYAPCPAGRHHLTSQLKTRLVLSKRTQAAIDNEIGARDVAALVGSQEKRSGSKFLRTAKSVERSRSPEAGPD